jgi:hypothetical protein
MQIGSPKGKIAAVTNDKDLPIFPKLAPVIGGQPKI